MCDGLQLLLEKRREKGVLGDTGLERTQRKTFRQRIRSPCIKAFDYQCSKSTKNEISRGGGTSILLLGREGRDENPINKTNRGIDREAAFGFPSRKRSI